MQLSQELETYIPEQRAGWRQVAHEWLRRWQATHPERWTPGMVEANVARLRVMEPRDHLRGVRFFFQDPARAELLLDLLGVPKDKATDLLKAGESLLSTQLERPTRLIVDLTTLQPEGMTTTTFFQIIQRDFLTRNATWPVALLMTRTQWEHLPRTFDLLEDHLEIHKVEDVASARARRDELLSTPDTLLVSTTPFTPGDRWVAASLYGDTLRLEPADALQRVSRQGNLSPMPTPTHSLAELPGIQLIETPLPTDPLTLRVLMYTLGDATAVEGTRVPAGTRLYWAQQLGITATSTREERVMATLGQATNQAITIVEASKAELDGILLSARRKRIGMTLLQIEDTLHILNAPQEAEAKLKGESNIVWHRVEPLLPAITRLQTALQAWTTTDAEEDPFLDRLLERLEQNETERNAFRHARATLRWTGTLPTFQTATPVADWAGALASLLTFDPPEATILPHIEVAPAPRAFEPFALNTIQLPTNFHPLLDGFGPLATPAVDRFSPLTIVSPGDPVPTDAVAGVLLPTSAEQALDGDIWTEFMEASPTCGGSMTQARQLWDNGWQQLLPRSARRAMHAEITRKAEADFTQAAEAWQARKPGATLPRKEELINQRAREFWQQNRNRWILPDTTPAPAWQLDPLSTPDTLWAEADRQLAMLWLALRRGLRRNESIRMPDGRVLLELGNGIVAKLEVLASEPTTVRGAHAAFSTRVRKTDTGWTMDPLLQPLATHRLGDNTASLMVPGELRLTAPGVLLRMELCWSPYSANTLGWGPTA